MELREGAVIADRFRLIRLLGEGGMGEVWVAQHTSLDIPCAVKFIHAESARRPEVRARFEREAKAAAGLESPHLARTLAAAVDSATGAPFFVMPLMVGSDVDGRLDQLGELHPTVAVRIVRQACRGLEAAHASEVVHRDVKPANLFLTHREDGSPCIKLVDFGISKQDDEAGPSLTGTHAVLGSPQFMSPEQLACCRDVDARADIWSLGATLFELLTLEHVFEGESLAELCTSIMRDPPRSLADQRFDTPLELDAILSACLEKDTSRRIASVEALQDRLTALRDLPPSYSQPRSAPSPAPPVSTIVMTSEERIEALDETPCASVRPVVSTPTRPPQPRNRWRLAAVGFASLLGLALVLEAPATPQPSTEAASAPSENQPTELEIIPEEETPVVHETPAKLQEAHEAPSRFSDSGLVSAEHRASIERALTEGRAALVAGNISRARSRTMAALARLRDVGVRPHESVSSLGARASLLRGAVEGAALRVLLNEPMDRRRAERLTARIARQIGKAQVAYELVRGWSVASFYRCAVAESASLHLDVGQAFARAESSHAADRAWLDKNARSWLRKARTAYRTAVRVPAETTLCLGDAKRGLTRTNAALAALPSHR